MILSSAWCCLSSLILFFSLLVDFDQHHVCRRLLSNIVNHDQHSHESRASPTFCFTPTARKLTPECMLENFVWLSLHLFSPFFFPRSRSFWREKNKLYCLQYFQLFILITYLTAGTRGVERKVGVGMSRVGEGAGAGGLAVNRRYAGNYNHVRLVTAWCTQTIWRLIALTP